MAFFIRRVLAAPLLLVNFGIYIVVVALAGWAINLAIDDGWEAVSYNPATFYFVIFALIAGVVGIASKLSAVHHLRVWRMESLAGSGAAATIAWLLTLLAMGLAFKEINYGGPRYLRLRFLEALVIIIAITQLFYLLAIGAGVYRGEYIVRKREANIEIPVAPSTSKEPEPAPAPA